MEIIGNNTLLNKGFFEKQLIFQVICGTIVIDILKRGLFMKNIRKYIGSVSIFLACLIGLFPVTVFAEGFATPQTNDYMVYIYVIVAGVALIALLAVIITMIVRNAKRKSGSSDNSKKE